jgi:hypothetical protein
MVRGHIHGVLNECFGKEASNQKMRLESLYNLLMYLRITKLEDNNEQLFVQHTVSASL